MLEGVGLHLDVAGGADLLDERAADVVHEVVVGHPAARCRQPLQPVRHVVDGGRDVGGRVRLRGESCIRISRARGHLDEETRSGVEKVVATIARNENKKV